MSTSKKISISPKRGLSVREEQILVLICEGFSAKEIALMMDKSFHTIVSYTHRIRVKTGCHKIATMVMYAVAHGIVEPQKNDRPKRRSAAYRISAG